jgi:hypothetical protein
VAQLHHEVSASPQATKPHGSPMRTSKAGGRVQVCPAEVSVQALEISPPGPDSPQCAPTFPMVGLQSHLSEKRSFTLPLPPSLGTSNDRLGSAHSSPRSARHALQPGSSREDLLSRQQSSSSLLSMRI